MIGTFFSQAYMPISVITGSFLGAFFQAQLSAAS